MMIAVQAAYFVPEETEPELRAATKRQIGIWQH